MEDRKIFVDTPIGKLCACVGGDFDYPEIFTPQELRFYTFCNELYSFKEFNCLFIEETRESKT